MHRTRAPSERNTSTGSSRNQEQTIYRKTVCEPSGLETQRTHSATENVFATLSSALRVGIGPLRKAGLLHLLEPETLVDKAATQELATAIGGLVRSGVFDRLKTRGTVFHELSYSRLGGYGDPKLAEAILKELQQRKLARKSKDGVSIPLHPVVRSTVLVLLAQILRPRGSQLGMELSPATDRPQLVEALSELLAGGLPASAGRVVAFDLETVAPDLTGVPLDEVLDFRKASPRIQRVCTKRAPVRPRDQRNAGTREG